VRQLSVELAVAALDGEDDLAPISQAGEDDEDGGLVLLQPRLDVDAIDPQDHRLEVGERPRAPQLVFGLPAGLQPRDRGGRQRSAITEQAAQGQIEVAQRQAVQVELRQELPHRLRPALEQRQQSALEALAQAADARPAEGDRAHAQAQPARLPEPVAIAGRRIDALPPHVAPAPQQRRDLFLQHPLQQVLHPLSGEGLQAFPDRP
jgi:hypothetical protein